MERPYRHVAPASCFLAALELVVLAPGGPDVQVAIAKHALAKGEIVGTYTQNPALMKKSKTVKKTS
jgi:hypothetical protein